MAKRTLLVDKGFQIKGMICYEQKPLHFVQNIDFLTLRSEILRNPQNEERNGCSGCTTNITGEKFSTKTQNVLCALESAAILQATLVTSLLTVTVSAHRPKCGTLVVDLWYTKETLSRVEIYLFKTPFSRIREHLKSCVFQFSQSRNFLKLRFHRICGREPNDFFFLNKRR